MTYRRFAILACLLSLALHGFFFFLAGRIAINGDAFAAMEKAASSAEEYHALHLTQPEEEPSSKKDPLEPDWEDGSEFRVPEFEELQPDASSADKSNELLRRQSEEVRKLLEERIPQEAPVEVYQLGATPQAQPALTPVAPMMLPQEALVLTAPRPEILEIHESDLAPERLTEARMMTTELDREFVPPEIALPSLADEGALAGPPPQATYATVDLQSMRPSFGLAEKDLAFLQDDSGNAETGDIPGALPGIDTKDSLGKVTLPDGALEETAPLDEFVTVDVRTYPDPAGSGGTFLVEIHPGPKSASMPDVSKDVLFIIDRSSSISFAKFKQFQKAVQEVLPALTPEDRFNIISFNEKQSTVFQEFTPGTPANLRFAQEKVAALPHGGRTDVFGGVAPFVRQSNGNLRRPLNIFLLTDGQSTVNIYQPSVFLRQVSGINPGNVSIFPFSAEKKANRMLLDFLGYLNRGEKCHVETTDEIREAMVRFYSEHASLLLTDVRCAATSGANLNEIFPRSLPHLYRNQTLRIFGRYENRADTLTLSITGRDAGGNLRDLVFLRKLDQCSKGDSTLPAQWAAQKILFLLSRLNLSGNPGEQSRLSRQIESLKKQYSILSPY